METVSPDRLRHLVDTMLDALGEGLNGQALAARAYMSRFHFDRLIAAGLGETPGMFRRRLLLERAAWQLRRGSNVTDTGFGDGYGSPEAFSRAFSRAFGVTPSLFGDSPLDFRLEAANGIHFHPPQGLLMPGTTKGNVMDLTDRLLEHDHWLTGHLLERARQLTDAQRDHPIRPGHEVLSFDGPEPTVRAMPDRLVWTKEVWVAAIAGRAIPDGSDRGLEAMRGRFALAGKEFCQLAQGIRDRNQWDDVFVDALCEPPQSFTLGGVLAHVITFSAYRRMVLIDALSELGVTELTPGDPMEWERTRR